MLLREEDIKKNILKDIMYNNCLIRDISKCIFCNDVKHHEFKDLKWESNFIYNYSTRSFICTVCPRCRTKTIQELMDKILERRLKIELK